MNKYEKTVNAILDSIGGKDNVLSFKHCISRLRIVLKDDSKINKIQLEEIENVKGVFTPNNQLHIIMGPDVPNYYKAMSELMNNEAIQHTEFKDALAKKGKWYQRMMTHFSEIFMPLIPALVAGGLILSFRNILETNFNGSAAVDISFWKSLNDFLWIPAAAVFWFLPVVICWSIFKKMNGSPVLGIIIGLSLLVELPSIYQLTGSANKSENLWIFSLINNNPAFKFGDWNYPFKLGYTAQVIPAILIAFIGVYIERFLNKYIPAVIKQIVVPLITILLAYTISMVIIGPLGYVIGYGISYVINLALTNNISKYFFAPIFGLIYAPLVVTGLHHALNAVMIQNAATLGGSFIFPILAISNIAQGAACLFYVILNKKDKKTREVGLSATVAAWLGVTEPAMYGINLKHYFPFFAAIISTAVGSLLLTIFGVTSVGIGNGGILSILSIQSESKIQGVNTLPGTGFTWFAIVMLVVIGLSFGLTYLFSKWNLLKKNFFKFKRNKATHSTK